MIRRRMKPLDSWESDRRNVSFIRFIEEGVSVRKACRLVGMIPRTMEKRRRRMVEFEAAVQAALLVGEPERRYRAWLGHPRRGKRPPTGKGHGGVPAYRYGRR